MSTSPTSPTLPILQVKDIENHFYNNESWSIFSDPNMIRKTARRNAEAHEEARRVLKAQEKQRNAEAHKEARRFLKEQEKRRNQEAMLYSQHNQFAQQYQFSQQRPRSNSPPQFVYHNGMLHIINSN